MTIRAGMANLILEIRRHTNTGTADYSVGGVTYWTDDQLQYELDRMRKDWHIVPLRPIPQVAPGNPSTPGTIVFYDYEIPAQVGRFIEENFGGTAGLADGWQLTDGAWHAIPGTAYSVNYQTRIISFVNNTMGSVCFLDCRSFSLWRAAANIWREKASAVNNQIDWKTDNHQISASQEYDHCMSMAQEYDKKDGVKSSFFMRSDEAPRRR